MSKQALHSAGSSRVVFRRTQDGLGWTAEVGVNGGPSGPEFAADAMFWSPAEALDASSEGALPSVELYFVQWRVALGDNRLPRRLLRIRLSAGGFAADPGRLEDLQRVAAHLSEPRGGSRATPEQVLTPGQVLKIVETSTAEPESALFDAHFMAAVYFDGIITFKFVRGNVFDFAREFESKVDRAEVQLDPVANVTMPAGAARAFLAAWTAWARTSARGGSTC